LVLPTEKPVRKAGDRFDLELPGGVKMAFAWCPSGCFTMGSPEQEQHRDPESEQCRIICFARGFFCGIHPVTQAELEAIMQDNPSRFEGERLPVDSVSWIDAEAFWQKSRELTGKPVRLPTEAEWEYACRGGTTTPFYWGSELNGTQANCNGSDPYGTPTSGPYLGRTTPVGSYATKFPHPWGLTDLHGNVTEWCADWYTPRILDVEGIYDPVYQVGERKARVTRGGSWGMEPDLCRAAFRNAASPDVCTADEGFRVVFNAD